MAAARVALVVVALVLAAGCGEDGEVTPTETETTDTTTATTPAAPSEFKVYWLRGGDVWPARREVESSAVASAALEALLDGPTEQEQADLGFTSAIPEVGVADLGLEIRGTLAALDPPSDVPRGALAQIVYTLTQFPTLEAVEIGGTSYTRADFEDETPAILVESPLPFEEVGSPLRVTGTANTFEATFQYTLTDTDGLIVDEGFVTATSGTGTRGTFDFTTQEYEVPFDGIGSLIVYESSAKDGSRINLVEIPLRMAK